MTDTEKKKLADFTIDNCGNLSNFYTNLENYYKNIIP